MLKYWNDKDKVLDKKDDQAFWKKLALERFRWIKDLTNYDDKEWTPAMLAKQADHISKFGASKSDDHLIQKTTQYFKSSTVDEVKDFKVYEDYDQNFSWLQLFLKLDFEHYIQMIPEHADLGSLHQYIHAVAPYMTNLYIKTQ